MISNEANQPTNQRTNRANSLHSRVFTSQAPYNSDHPHPSSHVTHQICIIIKKNLLQSRAGHVHCVSGDTATCVPQLPLVPRRRRITVGRRAFFVAGPMEWNWLPHSLRDPARSTDSFRQGSHCVHESKFKDFQGPQAYFFKD